MWTGLTSSAHCLAAGLNEQDNDLPILYETGNDLTRYKIYDDLSKDPAHAVTVEQHPPAWPVRRHPLSAYLCTAEMTVQDD